MFVPSMFVSVWAGSVSALEGRLRATKRTDRCLRGMEVRQTRTVNEVRAWTMIEFGAARTGHGDIDIFALAGTAPPGDVAEDGEQEEATTSYGYTDDYQRLGGE